MKEKLSIIKSLYQILVDISYELSIMSPFSRRGGRARLHERQKELAIVDPQIIVKIKVQPVIEKNDFKVVRRS